MRVSIRFDLPDESSEHRAALQGADLRAAVEEFDEYLRGKIKHEDCAVSEEARSHLLEILDEYGISLY